MVERLQPRQYLENQQVVIETEGTDLWFVAINMTSQQLVDRETLAAKQ